MADLGEKMAILAGAAKYDASCASSGSGTHTARGDSGQGKGTFGARVPAGVCHSWTEDGRCVSLLKVLFSNVCRFDCAYCVNRASADTPRSSFTVEELVDLTCQFYRRNYIEGLFLSSGIFADSDVVMEKLIETARTLRTQEGYGGYIHLKIIPGAGEKMIQEAGRWADRLSANIELPTEKSLHRLAPQKSGKLIFGAMENFSGLSRQFEEDRRRPRFLPQGRSAAPAFAPAGQSTQLIVGASAEDDRQIIGLSSSLYRKFSLRRVYYSAYTPAAQGGPEPWFPGHPAAAGPLFLEGAGARGGPPGPSGSGSPGLSGSGSPGQPWNGPPQALLRREHRLYQADWLLRFYHFSAAEILDESQPFLDPHLDPKTVWALKHLNFFPVEVNRADYEALLRVPGIGAKTARRIIESRRSHSLSFDSLRRLGAVMKRVRYFASCSGVLMDRLDDPRRIRRLLSGDDALQLPLFEF
ncbi:MAG: putative DNA modification/repair radical SAM protein [Treponema sp.]|jgi:predicted DNA-binding helix-hairpin-helix protein|nr:putative DNA modification/repair radical SAM protein [Treponema sp.]